MQHEDLDKLCEEIAELQVRRKFAINLVNKQTSAAKALVRRALGWKWDEAEDVRETINKRAERIVDAALADREPKPEDAEIRTKLASDLAAVREALAPCVRRRATIEKEMVRLAKALPAHSWQKSIHGFGEVGLAIIVGEAGNLSRYDSDDKLKKRFGLAPYQGKAFSTWRMTGGLSSIEWEHAGYTPKRRGELHGVVTDPLFRQQSEWQEKVLKDGSIRPFRPAIEPYGTLYYRRRERTAVTHPEWKPIQSHKDALRIITQRLISDLWSEWRRARVPMPETARSGLPSAEALAA